MRKNAKPVALVDVARASTAAHITAHCAEHLAKAGCKPQIRGLPADNNLENHA